MEHLENWNYGVIKTLQSQLRPLLDALKKLRKEGLTAALVLSAVHHRRVLPLMSRSLRMDEMGPGVSSRDLEACRMSNEASPYEEFVARVRAAVAGDFQPEQVNGFPMKPQEGYYDLVSPSIYCSSTSAVGFIIFFQVLRDLSLFCQGTIDARSSKPPVKEDNAEREKRRASVEKHKSIKDAEKKEKKKNLERQALEEHRAKSRRGGV